MPERAVAQLALGVDEACVLLTVAHVGALALAGDPRLEGEALKCALHVTLAHEGVFDRVMAKLRALGEWHDANNPNAEGTHGNG